MHGCFWHRHEGCRFTSSPKSRVEFWTEKFQKNVDRDNRVKEDLETAGIKMLIVWECTIKQMIKSQETEEKILQEIGGFSYQMIFEGNCSCMHIFLQKSV